MKKLLLQAIVVVVGIMIGTAAGGYMTFHSYARNYAIVRAFAWTGISSAVAANQYDKNTNDAKEDLVYSLNFYSQGVESSAIDSTLKKMLCMNRGLTEARLSVVESEASNVDLANSYLSRAEEDLKAVGWLNVSRANILQTVERQALSPCNTTSQNEKKASASPPPKTCG